MLEAIKHDVVTLAVCILIVLALAWTLMRTLWLPRIGCWVFYLFTLFGIFVVLLTGLAFVAASTLIKNYFENPAHKNSEFAWLGGASVGLMLIGKGLLSARKKKPFQFVMKWFLKFSFTSRVGATLPQAAIDDPRRLAFRAVYDDSYGDKDYGTIDGWGVRACCNRLLRIKHSSQTQKVELADGAKTVAMSMSSRFIFLILVCIALVAMRLLSNLLRTKMAHEMVAALPGAATLGFYAATATTYLAMALWHATRHRSVMSLFTRHSLLFLTIAGFSIDYVLNNYKEITAPKDGSYGLVVLIDFIIWGILWFVSILHFPKDGYDYSESIIVWLIPLLPVLRQVVHAKDPFHFGPATVDLVVGIIFMAAWILLPYGKELQSKYSRTGVAAKYLIFLGALYALTSIVENVLSHFLGLDAQITSIRKFFGGFWFNSTVLALSATLALVLFYCNPRNLREHFAGPCA